MGGREDHSETPELSGQEGSEQRDDEGSVDLSRWRIVSLTSAAVIIILTPVVIIGLFTAGVFGAIPFWVLAAIGSIAVLVTMIPMDNTVYDRPNKALNNSLLILGACVGWSLVGYTLLNWVATAFPSVLQIIILSFLLLMTLAMAGLLSIRRTRDWFFEELIRTFWRATPFPYLSVLLVWLSSLFGCLTFALQRHGLIELHSARGTKPTVNMTMEFYLWQFADAIPVLKVTEKLNWAEPLQYKGSAEGVLVVSFTLLVIVSVFATFVEYWQSLGQGARQSAP